MKKISTIIILTILNIHCTALHIIPNFHYEINQGKELKDSEIKKIRIGMTKSEILKKIGFPTLTDIFESNTWYYIYYHYDSKKKIKQKMLTLKFNQYDTLIYTKNYE